MGVGLLLAGRLEGKTRRAVGWSLLAVGALSTVPILAHVLGKTGSTHGGEGSIDEGETSH